MASYEELIRQAKNSKLGKAIARLGPSQGQSQAVSSIKNYAQPYAQSFSAGAKQMGSGVGGAIRAPFDMYFNNQSAATNNRVSDMLRQQQARAMKSGNLTTARDRSQKIERLQNLNADTQINMGQQMNKDRTDSALGTGRVGLQLLGAKGITAPSLLGNTALFSGIGYGITRASGGSNADAITAAGSAGGDALMYRGINKVSDKLFTNPLLRMAGQKGNIPVRIGLGAGVNALANIGEDEVTTRITQGRAPTNQERLISGAIGTVTGGLSGGMGARQQLKGVEVPKVTTFKHQLELLAEQPRKMGKYSSSDISTAASVVLGKRKFPTKPTEGFTELFAYMNKQLNNEKYGDLLPKTDATSGMTRRVPGFIDPSAKVGGEAPKIEPQVKISSGGNIYIKTGKNQVINGIPKTVQNDLNSLLNGEVVNPDRMFKTKEYLRRRGIDLVRNEDTFKYDLKSNSTPVATAPKGNITQALPDIQNRSMADQAGKPPSTEQIKPQETNTVLSTSASKPIVTPSGKVPSREAIASALPQKLDSFIQKTLGYSTQTPKGGLREASGYTKALRKGQEAISTRIETGMGSDNALVRNAATTVQNFFRGAGMSPDRANASMELRGGIGTANDRAYNVMESLYKSLGNNKNSLQRINAVLDPSLAKTKVSFKDLTPLEKQVYGIIREGFDLVHDTSYANGHITPELYAKNKGKYTPRLYEVTELPQEVSAFVTQGKRLSNDLYKSRKSIDEWKVENNLNDPVYSLGKRLSQVETNSAIKKYTDYLASNPRFISDVEKPGFVKLSDSPAYGDLSGKYVLNSAAEDLKGFFFSNQAMQNLYDVFRAYDRLTPRQLQKKLLTVFNPTTNVGNIVSDQVFGFVTGVDPLSLNKNLLEFKANPAKYKQLSDYLMKQGITGTDITRTDFVNKLGQINSLANGARPSKLKVLSDKVTSFYGGTDDVYKTSAFKSLLDKGYTLEEATRKVADGFQNYANVGKFYDVWAKTPIVGSAFIKFQGDLIRIIKNGAVNNPLGLIGFLGALQSVAYLSSKASGETAQDKKTREDRFAAPKIPGLGISLEWQTPIGAINAARYISPFYANNETTNVAKMLPFVPTIDTKKDVASNIAINANDPLLSTPLQLLVDRDFRGKPISDPESNKYRKSLATSGEKLKNRSIFAARSYTPPPVNSLLDVNSALQGKPNMYGATQTPGQAIARVGGIKISQFGPEQAQAQRENDLKYKNIAKETINKNISSIQNDFLKGDITQEQATQRIQEQKNQLNKQNGDTTEQISGVGIGLDAETSYEKKSDLKLYDQITPDEATAYYMREIPAKTSARYGTTVRNKKIMSRLSDVSDSTKLSDTQKNAIIEKLTKEAGITVDDYKYYEVAKQPNEAKIAYAYDTLDQSKSFDDFMKYLVNGRKPVNGQILVSDGVIDDLVNEGVIPYSVGKEIKDIDLNEDGTHNMGKIRAKSRKSGAAQQKKILAIQKKDAEARMKAVNDLYNNLRKINPVSSGTPGKIKATSKVNTKALTFSGR